MLRNFVIFSLCLVATHAEGGFSVLSIPKAVAFKGSNAIDSQYVGDVMNTVMGNPASANAQWDGLFINDPFSLVDKVVVVVLKGVDYIQSPSAKTYQLNGDSVEASLSELSDTLKTNNVPLCNLNFKKFNEAVSELQSCFGNIEPVTPESDVLKQDLDQEFLQSVGYINAAAENFMKKKGEVIIFHLSAESISEEHRGSADVLKAASKLATEAIDNLNSKVMASNNDEAFVVVITEKLTSGNRRKREAIVGSTQNQYNLAAYYNQDYPVIFNIILWFMVTFGLSLLAICYAIGDMDPGRDSIIYRMTSTRMKKDN